MPHGVIHPTCSHTSHGKENPRVQTNCKVPLTYQKYVSDKSSTSHMWYHISHTDISSFYCFLLPYFNDQLPHFLLSTLLQKLFLLLQLPLLGLIPALDFPHFYLLNKFPHQSWYQKLPTLYFIIRIAP